MDDTACALFLDLRNTGVQDLVVLRDAGPVLLLNRGDKFELRTDAFEFATSPAGGFTGMAAADYDKDGKLDLYLCSYVYFQSRRNTHIHRPITMRKTARRIFCFTTG